MPDPTPILEETTPSPNTGGVQAPTNNQRRSRKPGTRNSNLATMANAERVFSGKTEDLSIIGNPYEQGATFDKMIEDLVSYSILKLEEGDDLILLLEKQLDVLNWPLG